MSNDTDRNTGTTPAWSHSQQHDDDAKHRAEHGERQQQSTADASRAARRGQTRPAAKQRRSLLVIDSTDPWDEPSTATPGEAGDALGLDASDVLWAIEEHGRCDGASGLLVVPLTGHEEDRS